MTEAISTVPAHKVPEIISAGAVIIDVRTAMEHQEKRLDTAHDHIPLDTLNPQDFMLRRGLDRDDPVYILCRSGGRARQALEKFKAAGYGNVHVIEGGLMACEATGAPVTGLAAAANDSAAMSAAQGMGGGIRKTITIIPLERQVRIAAGALVVVGALLGFALSPLFHALSLFVGAGLVYAGITDRCGMGLLLAKAPWNRVDTAQNSGATCSVGAGSCSVSPARPLSGDKASGGGCS